MKKTLIHYWQYNGVPPCRWFSGALKNPLQAALNVMPVKSLECNLEKISVGTYSLGESTWPEKEEIFMDGVDFFFNVHTGERHAIQSLSKD